MTLPGLIGDVGPVAKRQLPLITNSEMRTFRRCAREHKYAYRLLRRPKTTAEALFFGNLQHIALEAWWLAPPNQVARLEASMAALAGAKCDDPYQRAKAEALMIGYTARWGAQEDWETIAVESQFRAPIINPATGHESKTYQLGGKLDVVVRDRVDGRKLLIEHKTTSEDLEVGSRYWQRVSALDSQVSSYLIGARAAGHAVDSCIYDVIRKPLVRPKMATPMEARKYTAKGFLYANQRETDETPDEFRERVCEAIAEDPMKYYGRGEIVRLDSDESEHLQDVWHTARLIREADLENRHPRNPDACIRYGSECPYLPVCSGETHIDDDTRYRSVSDGHEELAVEEIRT